MDANGVMGAVYDPVLRALRVEGDPISGGAVNSVNGMSGTVVLTAADVGADPAGAAQTVDDALDAHLADTSDAHDASAISFVATGSISSTDVQAAIAETASESVASLLLKAPLASPTFTGTVTVPDGSFTLAKLTVDPLARANHTGFQAESTVTNLVTDLAAKAALASPTFTGTPAAPTAAQGTSTTQLATTAMVQSEVTLLAPKASPALTGNPTAPTQSAGNNSTRVATTAYADALVADAINDATTGIAPSQNAVFDALALKAHILTTTATKTSNYSFNAFEFVPLDTTGGTTANPLPTAPADGTICQAIWIAGTVTPTITSGGSDVLNIAGATSASFFGLYQCRRFTYRTSGAIWFVENMPSKTSLDASYKQIHPRQLTITSSATPTINTDLYDGVYISALAAAITSMTTNLTGTPTTMFDKLEFAIKDDGTARAITWGASFEAKGTALPSTTVISKLLRVGFEWSTVTSKWGCVAASQEA